MAETTSEFASNQLPDLVPREPGHLSASPIPRHDWINEPWSRWTYQHTSEMMPTAPIWRGPGPVRPLPTSLQPLGGIRVDLHGRNQSITDILEQSGTDGFLILHKGRIVFERHYNDFTPHTQHLVMSVTKSFTGTVAVILADKGIVDLQKPVTHYLPELQATAYRGATLQQVLDMASGVTFDETPVWMSVWYHEQEPGWPRTYWEAILGLDKSERAHGAAFNYRDIETAVAAFCLQRASGKSLADLISDEIWSPMGAERDAYIVVDESGFGTASSGFCATMRDLGRFAQLFVEGGAWQGRQVVPQRRLKEIQHGKGWRFEDGQRGYHNFWWIEDSSRGSIAAHGYGGQEIYIDPEAEFAGIRLSHRLQPHDDVLRVVMPAIRDALQRR